MSATTTPGHLRGWEVKAKAQIDRYDDEVAGLSARNGGLGAEAAKALALATERLGEAKQARDHHHGFAEYWTGAAQEETWRAVHEADVVLTYAREADAIRAELPGLKQRVRLRVADGLYREDLLERVKPVEGSLNDQAKTARETSSGAPPPGPGGSTGASIVLTDADRAAVAHVKQEVYDIADEGFESQRTFRNLIWIMTLAAAAVAAALAILGLFDDTITYRLDVYPHDGQWMWPETIWPIELIGALAGFIVAITSLRKLSGRGPYGLRSAQAALKVPMGALTALVGMLLLQSGALEIGPLESKAAFIGWVLVFGAAQELVTRLVDQKAASVVDDAAPKS